MRGSPALFLILVLLYPLMPAAHKVQFGLHFLDLGRHIVNRQTLVMSACPSCSKTRTAHDIATMRAWAYREPSQQPERRPGRVVSSKELDSEMAVMKAKQPPVAPKRYDRLAHLIDASLSRDATRNAETRTSLLRGESGHL